MDANRFVIKGTLLLYSPWLKLNGDIIGSLKVPELIQCNYENEFKNLTPKIVDLYLTWAREKRVFSHHTTPEYDLHNHSLYHSHSKRETPLFGGSVSYDDDDGGYRQDVSSPGHSHEIELDSEYLNVSSYYPGSEIPIINEPRHKEINAYYVEKSVKIPVGAIIFFIGDTTPTKWRDLSRKPLDYDPTEPYNQYKDRLWLNIFLKIVGCWPAINTKGLDKHTHFGAKHNHVGGTASPSTGTVRIDRSDDEDGIVANQNHSHPVVDVDNSVDFVKEALNAPRNYGVRILVCEEENAEWHKGMIIPFIPKQQSDFETANLPDGWNLFDDNDQHSEYPIYLRAVDEEEQADDYYGKEKHYHEFPHSHKVKLGPADRSFNKIQDDPDVSCAIGGHSHIDVTVSDEITSGEGINVLPNREVNLLIYTG